MTTVDAARGTREIANLSAIAARTGDLPVMPATCLKALRMTQEENCSPKDLQQVISQRSIPRDPHQISPQGRRGALIEAGEGIAVHG